MTAVAWVFLGAFLVALLLLALAMGCNATLVAEKRRLRALAEGADRRANDYADRIAEHEARETALKIICAANGIEVIDPDQPLPLMDEAELVAAEADPEFSPADIDWWRL